MHSPSQGGTIDRLLQNRCTRNPIRVIAQIISGQEDNFQIRKLNFQPLAQSKAVFRLHDHIGGQQVDPSQLSDNVVGTSSASRRSRRGKAVLFQPAGQANSQTGFIINNKNSHANRGLVLKK